MPDDLIPVDEAVRRSRPYWLMECAFVALAFSALAILWALFNGAQASERFAMAIAAGFAVFLGIAVFFRVYGQVLRLKRLHAEFGYTLSRENYRPRAFAGKLVSGEFGKILAQMLRERRAGLR